MSPAPLFLARRGPGAGRPNRNTQYTCPCCTRNVAASATVCPNCTADVTQRLSILVRGPPGPPSRDQTAPAPRPAL